MKKTIIVAAITLSIIIPAYGRSTVVQALMDSISYVWSDAIDAHEHVDILERQLTRLEGFFKTDHDPQVAAVLFEGYDWIDIRDVEEQSDDPAAIDSLKAKKMRKNLKRIEVVGSLAASKNFDDVIVLRMAYRLNPISVDKTLTDEQLDSLKAQIAAVVHGILIRKKTGTYDSAEFKIKLKTRDGIHALLREKEKMLSLLIDHQNATMQDTAYYLAQFYNMKDKDTEKRFVCDRVFKSTNKSLDFAEALSVCLECFVRKISDEDALKYYTQLKNLKSNNDINSDAEQQMINSIKGRIQQNKLK